MCGASSSAPGKVLWIGGYSILSEGTIAHVFPVDAFVTAAGGGGGAESRFTRAAREVVGGRLGRDMSHVPMRVSADGAFRVGGRKTGLGSSAAVAVACVSFLLGGSADRRLVFRLARRAHFIAQEKVGSGFDIACAVYGPIVYKRRPLRISPLPFPQGLKTVFAFTGKPVDTAGIVRKVTARRGFAARAAEIDAINRECISFIRRGKCASGFGEAFQEAWRLTAKLHPAISPPSVSKAVDRALASGALCAKSPGAGGGDIVMAAAASAGDAWKVEQEWRRMGLLILPVKPVRRGLLPGKG